MSQNNSSAMVGNEFTVTAPSLRLATPLPAEPVVSLPIIPASIPHREDIVVTVHSSQRRSLSHILEPLYRHSVIVFALLVLLVGVAATQVGGRYWSAHIAALAKPAAGLPLKKPLITGLSLSVPTSELASKLQTITSQPASLSLGSQSVALSPATIRSWLQVTTSASGSESYIYVKSNVMAKSLSDIANKYVYSPVNQVSVSSGGVSQVVVAGHSGTQLSDPGTLAAQAHDTAKSLMDSKGLQFSTPLVSLPFAALTPAAFTKLIEVNVTTKQMYLYDSGQLTRSYPISAGAPATPTPLGEFHIYAKYSVQNMTGPNADGTTYFQPHVQWINYFSSGDAVHGNYWRPLSYFGNINSSHGCVSLPNDQAQWVYNWAPIGTTVITHA